MRNEEFKCQFCYIIYSKQQIQQFTSVCYGLLDFLDEILYKFDKYVAKI